MKTRTLGIVTILTYVVYFSVPAPPVVEAQESEELPETLPLPAEEKEVKEKLPLRVRTTYYNPEVAQTDSTPLVTADGSVISLKSLEAGELHWIAVSRDLLVEFPLGSRVEVVSRKYPQITGTYEVHDVMNPRYKYSIDILSPTNGGHVFGTHLTEIIRKK